MTAVAQETGTPVLGQQLEPLHVGRISRTTLALFAGGSGDHNPIHLDLDVARSAGLTDVFAQGMLSMAYLGRFITDRFGAHPLLNFSTRFVSITPINAEPICFGEIVAVDDMSFTIDLRVELADGTVTLTGQATLSTKGNAL